MFSHLERPDRAPPGWRQILANFGPTYVASGFIGFVFAATAPVAIILSVGSRGGLTEAELASWIFGVFFINGWITVLFCWLYRQLCSAIIRAASNSADIPILDQARPGATAYS